MIPSQSVGAMAGIAPWRDQDTTIKRLLKPPARLVFGSLGWIQERLLPDYQLRYSPVFIIGIPRSGTTLLCQVANHALATCYFTNLASRLRVQGIRRPPVVFSAWLAKSFKLTDRRQETFQSDYGMTRGWGNPTDNVMIWQHWFPNHPMCAGELPPDDQRAVYQAVAGTERVFGRPFVDKCTHSSLRIPALAEVFPTALLILCIRNPLAIAQSLYVGWTRSGRPPDKWGAARPEEFEDLKHKSVVERVCGLVYYLQQNIAQGLAAVSPERILSVDYRNVCLDPQRQVSEIADFMNRHGAPTKQIRPVPTRFPFSHTRRVDVTTYQALIDQLEHLYGHEMERLDEPS